MNALHAWFTVAFVYGTWTECECGFRPADLAEFDSHTAEYGIATEVA